MTQTSRARELPAPVRPPTASAQEPVGQPARPFPERGPTWVYTDEPIFKLSVEAYHELIRLGCLNSDDKVELIEGALVHRMSKNPPHEFAKGQLVTLLNRLLPPGWFTRIEAPVTLSDSEPEPDVSVARGTARDYLARHPKVAEIGLVVEIADSTLRRDRGSKRRVYAQGGIGNYWIVNLAAREIEVYTDPSPAADPPAYAEPQRYGEGDAIPVVLDGVTIGSVAVSDVLP